MTLDRRAYLSVCLAGVLFMAGSVFILWSRWKTLSPAPDGAAEKPAAEPMDPVAKTGTGWPGEPTRAEPPPAAPAAPVPQAAKPLPAAKPVPTVPAVPTLEHKRNIRFTYRDSKPTKVEIVASFNNWTPAPLTKGENHTWEVAVELAPGDYTYNFLVDGKARRDPNNPRTAPEGRSLLVVKPFSQ